MGPILIIGVTENIKIQLFKPFWIICFYKIFNILVNISIIPSISILIKIDSLLTYFTY
ncbi:hypothetical protein MASR2M12_21980 [Bacteroidales bacterium]